MGEKEVLQEIDYMLDKFADRVFFHSQQNLIDDGKVDTGNLLKTANIDRKFFEKTIVYPADNSEWVEFGRTAGSMPPPQSLHKWVRRKLGITNDRKIKSVAFAIAKSIEQRGIDQTPFMRDAIAQAGREFGL